MRAPMNKSLAVLVTTGLAGFGLAGLSGTSSAASGNPLVYGLTETNQIVQFRANEPGTILATSAPVPVAGDLEGIDIRPATGELYGLLNSLAGADALVVINPTTGAVVRTLPLTAGPDQSVTPVGTTGTSLEGDEFAFDFNPAIDRIRVVSNTDDNYVLNPDTGAIQAKQPDVRRVGDATSPDVRGAAYTNNVATQTATTAGTVLLDLDIEGADFVRSQSAAGATSGELTPVGPTGTDVATPTVTLQSGDVNGASVGFDIEARTDNAFAVLETAPRADGFYRVSRTTGAATLVGQIGSTAVLVEDITVASPRISLQSAATVREGATTTLTVTRTGDLDDEILVPFTASGTPTATTAAAEDGDFSPTSGVVRFAPGATQTVATFAARAQDGVEGSESFQVVLGQPSTPNAAVTAANRGIVTITDDGLPATTQPVPAPGTGGTASASPSAQPTATATGSPSPTATGTAPAAVQCGTPLRISTDRDFIIPTIPVRVTVTGPVGAIVDLQAYSRPNTEYRSVRTATIANDDGTVTFDVVPGTNTRLYAQCVNEEGGAGQAGSVSAQRVINVRTALSLTVVRNGRRDYTFQGRILPRRAGQLITLYRVEDDGTRVITSQLKTDATGTYRLRRVFLGSGVFGFLTRTGQTLTNAAGESTSAERQRSRGYLEDGRGTPRPTAIF